MVAVVEVTVVPKVARARRTDGSAAAWKTKCDWASWQMSGKQQRRQQCH
jgi:hypothetical protein